MNEVLFFTGATIIIGLSYYIGRQDGIKKNFKEEVKSFLMSLTISKMTADYFDRCAVNETKQFLKFLGVKKINEKFIIVPKKPTVEEFDKFNK